MSRRLPDLTKPDRNPHVWNDSQAILVMFSAPETIASFSIQQDRSGFGNPQADGSYMVFLDSTGHEIAGTQVHYTQGGHPGLVIQSSGTVANVSAVLPAVGSSYATCVSRPSLSLPGTSWR